MSCRTHRPDQLLVVQSRATSTGQSSQQTSKPVRCHMLMQNLHKPLHYEMQQLERVDAYCMGSSPLLQPGEHLGQMMSSIVKQRRSMMADRASKANAGTAPVTPTTVSTFCSSTQGVTLSALMPRKQASHAHSPAAPADVHRAALPTPPPPP
jgi:hypothetical protein